MMTTKTGTRYHFAYSREDLDLSEHESPIPVPPANHRPRPRPGGAAYIRPAQRQPAASVVSTEMTLGWVIVCAVLAGSILGMLLLVVAVEISWLFWPGAGSIPWPF